MSKKKTWTPADTAYGRYMLSQAFEKRDPITLDEFYDWLDANVYVTITLVRETMDKVWKADDKSRALKLYDAMLSGYDPTAYLVGVWIKIGFFLLVLGGLSGGVLYLFRTLFGH